MTILDIYLAALCRWAVLYPRGEAIAAEQLAELPQLSELLGRIQQLPAIARVMPEHKISSPYFIQPAPPALPANQVSAS